jgi:hypothetical protein
MEPFAKTRERVAIGDDRNGWLFSHRQRLEWRRAFRSTSGPGRGNYSIVSGLKPSPSRWRIAFRRLFL